MRPYKFLLLLFILFVFPITVKAKDLFCNYVGHHDSEIIEEWNYQVRIGYLMDPEFYTKNGIQYYVDSWYMEFIDGAVTIDFSSITVEDFKNKDTGDWECPKFIYEVKVDDSYYSYYACEDCMSSEPTHFLKLDSEVEEETIEDLEIKNKCYYRDFLDDKYFVYSFAINYYSDGTVKYVSPSSNIIPSEFIDFNLDSDRSRDINIDLNSDGTCDINCDSNSDGIPDYNLDYKGERKAVFKVVDKNGGYKNLINRGYDSSGNCKFNCDTNNNGWPDKNIDYDGDDVIDYEIDTDDLVAFKDYCPTYVFRSEDTNLYNLRYYIYENENNYVNDFKYFDSSSSDQLLFHRFTNAVASSLPSSISFDNVAPTEIFEYGYSNDCEVCKYELYKGGNFYSTLGNSKFRWTKSSLVHTYATIDVRHSSNVKSGKPCLKKVYYYNNSQSPFYSENLFYDEHYHKLRYMNEYSHYDLYDSFEEAYYDLMYRCEISKGGIPPEADDDGLGVFIDNDWISVPLNGCTEETITPLIGVAYLSDYVEEIGEDYCVEKEEKNEEMFFCEENGVKQSFQIIGYLLFALKIAIPLILMGLGILDFSKALISEDDKVTKETAIKFAKRIISGVVIFFIPTVLNFIFSLIDDIDKTTSKYEGCTACLFNPLDETKCSFKKVGFTEEK